MCLAAPARILEIDGDRALVEEEGNRLEVSLKLIPEVQAGDYVLIHAGFAINKLNREEAGERIQLLEEYRNEGMG